MPGLKDLLTNAEAYIGLQKILGADQMRYQAIDALDLKCGDVVVDVGCGPAYYYPKLPQPITYYGFDTHQPYVDWARQRFGSDGTTFRCQMFDDAAAKELPPVTGVLLLGLLHHLDNADCGNLLKLAGKALARGGRVVTVDPCYAPGQNRIARWFADNDRGNYVRAASEFEAMAGLSFDKVASRMLDTTRRLPSIYLMMTMSDPAQ